MKFPILFLFWFANIFAQQQFRTSDFGYSHDVVKVEESLYKFNIETKEFVRENTYTTEAPCPCNNTETTYLKTIDCKDSAPSFNWMSFGYSCFYTKNLPDCFKATIGPVSIPPARTCYGFPSVPTEITLCRATIS